MQRALTAAGAAVLCLPAPADGAAAHKLLVGLPAGVTGLVMVYGAPGSPDRPAIQGAPRPAPGAPARDEGSTVGAGSGSGADAGGGGHRAGRCLLRGAGRR